jgi:flagellar hook protein FlgE
MPFSFSTALSGLRASSNALSVTGNNIANSNTVGFKSGAASFADIFSNSLGTRLNGAGGAVQIGNGVQTTATTTNFSQGVLIEANSPTSAAIQGNGFFVVSDNVGALGFTRAGDFTLNQEGFLVMPGGQRVQGYAAVNGQIPPGATITSMQVPIGETMAPVETTEATLRLNLNSADAAGAVFHAPVNVFDSRGVSHTLDMVFTKQADGSYLMNATLDGDAAQASVDGGAASAAPVAITFDENGLLTAPTSLSIAPDQTPLTGANLTAIEINLRQPSATTTPGPSNFTNFAATSAVGSTAQDGFGPGTLSGLAFSPDGEGTLYGVFSNGQTRPIGQFALALFNSQQGLRHLGGNLFGETPASGQPSIGSAGAGGRGGVVGGSLEQSNVDIATEFTDLIVAQRSFQANSRVINTINQTMQDLLQNI